MDPDDAVRHVAERLPALDPAAGAALALVEVAGRPRAEAAEHAGTTAEEIGELLAVARKALRRSVEPLPGSGWCERAERLISDRLDGALEPPGPQRLDVHLANCSRCVEHEVRLAQATEALLRAFVERQPRAETAPERGPETAAVEAPAPELTVVPPASDEPPAAREPREKPEAAPAAAVPSAPAVSRRLGERLVALAWHGLFALTVVLAAITVVVAVIGILGGEL